MPEIANTESYRLRKSESRKGDLRVKHIGDVQKINGSEIEKVDCITFGAPC